MLTNKNPSPDMNCISDGGSADEPTFAVSAHAVQHSKDISEYQNHLARHGAAGRSGGRDGSSSQSTAAPAKENESRCSSWAPITPGSSNFCSIAAGIQALRKYNAFSATIVTR